jgi:hypothetical protein
MVIEDGMLMSTHDENSKDIWYAETDKDFYAKGTYQFIHFKQDQDGRATGFQFEFFNGSFFVEKVK